jgi:hypothetical protein
MVRYEIDIVFFVDNYLKKLAKIDKTNIFLMRF